MLDMTTPHYASPKVIDDFIAFIINQNTKSVATSKTKQPCTHCHTLESTTWRPGPCGASTLCNTCGVKYMDSGKRNRQIDLILKKGVPIWVKKDATSWMWKEDQTANVDDPRIRQWVSREQVRLSLTGKMNPPSAKRRRL